MPVSLLWPPADSGDCQHFVALCEVIRAIDAGRVSIQLLHAFFSVCINDNIAYTVLHCTDISGDLAIDAGSNHPTLRFGAENPGRLRVLLGHAESPLPVLTRQRPVHFPALAAGGHHPGLLCQVRQGGQLTHAPYYLHIYCVSLLTCILYGDLYTLCECVCVCLCM